MVNARSEFAQHIPRFTLFSAPAFMSVWSKERALHMGKAHTHTKKLAELQHIKIFSSHDSTTPNRELNEEKKQQKRNRKTQCKTATYLNVHKHIYTGAYIVIVVRLWLLRRRR